MCVARCALENDIVQEWMAVAGGLLPIWYQGIKFHHDDMRRPVYQEFSD